MPGPVGFLADVWRTVAGVSLGALTVALALHVVKVACEARSWHGIVSHTYRAGRVPFRTTFGAFAGSIGVNAVLPARVGEALRLGIVRRGVADSSVVTIAATIALETVLEILFGAAIVTAWLAGGGSVGGGGSVAHHLAGLAVQPLTLIAGAAVALAVAAATFRYRARARPLVARLAEGFSILREPGTFASSVLTWKGIAWVLRLATVVAFLVAFHMPAAPWTALAVVAAQTVAGAVPLLPGNAGTQQAAIGVALAGTASATALVGFGVGMQAATTMIDLVLGAVALALVSGIGDIRGALPRWTRRRTADAEGAPA